MEADLAQSNEPAASGEQNGDDGENSTDSDEEVTLDESYSGQQFTDGGRDTVDDDLDDDPDDRLPPGWRDGPPEDAIHPPGWTDWDREAKLNYLTLGQKRADLLAHIRGFIGSDRGSDRLNKRELAMVAIDLEAISA